METQGTSRFPPEADRALVVWMWECGQSARTIARDVHISVTTVYRWVRQWKQEGSLTARPRSRKVRATPPGSSSAVVALTCQPAASLGGVSLNPHYHRNQNSVNRQLLGKKELYSSPPHTVQSDVCNDVYKLPCDFVNDSLMMPWVKNDICLQANRNELRNISDV